MRPLSSITGQVVLIEPDVALARTIEETVGAAGLHVVTCGVPRKAVEVCQYERPDVVVSELAMPGIDGLSILMELQRLDAAPPLILLSERGGAVNEAVGLRLGVADWLNKPFDVNELAARIQALLRRVLPPLEVRAKPGSLDHLMVAASQQRLWDLEQENRQLRAEMARDAMTGLFSRRYFDERLRQEMQRARRQRRPLSLGLADIDQFKSINDRYGHGAGDLALRTVGKLAQETVRIEDCPARVGGDEFAFILPDTTVEQAEVPSERWRQAAEQVELPRNLRLSLSLGVTDFVASDTEAAFIERADRAMYSSKGRGGNTLTAESSVSTPDNRPKIGAK